MWTCKYNTLLYCLHTGQRSIWTCLFKLQIFHTRNDSTPGSPLVQRGGSRAPSPFHEVNNHVSVPAGNNYRKRTGGLISLDKSSVAFDLIFNKALYFAAVFQVFLGLYLSVMSTSYMYGYMKSTGQLIGLLVVGVGVFGLLAGFFKQHIHLKTFLLVLLAFCAMLTLEYSASVDRGITVDCTFTEAYLRINHIEQRMQQMKHDELVSHLFSRLHEMDDLLDMAQQGTLHQIEVASRQSQLRDQDLNYIESKIEGIQKHAERAVRELVQKQNDITDSAVENQAQLTESDMESIMQEQKLIRMKIDAADSVIKFIKRKQEIQDQISGHEYELLLEALMSGHVDEQIRKEREELPFVQAAWERKERDEYHTIDAGQHLTAAQSLRQEREIRRQKFQEEFEKLQETHTSGHGDHFRQGLQNAIQDLPEHCIKEMSWMNSMYKACWLILASLVVSGYSVLSQQVSQIVQIKKD
eukprot:TRINITY_DN5768_c0_g2_i2.p1 TRINITY_DN5768_c0_g2~~TRINITY_DN5768_c0_g2_i2.p1  ORF type:complete len:468 (-),score=41.58 TRINITY_DN5768_c0_g2_i2:2011-3414(-)